MSDQQQQDISDRWTKMIIRDYYNQKEQSLLLFDICTTWKRVLKYQDWSPIKKLTISSCEVDSQIDMISKMEWPNLEKLVLDFNNSEVKDIIQIFKSNFPKLTQLSLKSQPIGNFGFTKLLQMQMDHFPNLQNLSMYSNKIQAQGLRFAPNFPLMGKLKMLSMDENKIGSKGIKLLNKIRFDNLIELRIQKCDIGSEGFYHLTKAQMLKLKKLIISHNQIELGLSYANYLNTSSILQIVDHVKSSSSFMALAASQLSNECSVQIGYFKKLNLSQIRNGRIR